MTIVSTPTPTLQPIVEVASQIRELEAKRAALVKDLVSDCEFMDIPVLEMYYFDVDVDGRDRTPGTVYHVVEVSQDWCDGDTTGLRAHPADACDGKWCRAGERVKFPKHAHVGSRTFYERRTDHVLAGTERRVEESMFGAGSVEIFILVPMTQGREVAR